jgi:hypothetical protein
LRRGNGEFESAYRFVDIKPDSEGLGTTGRFILVHLRVGHQLSQDALAAATAEEKQYSRCSRYVQLIMTSLSGLSEAEAPLYECASKCSG